MKPSSKSGQTRRRPAFQLAHGAALPTPRPVMFELHIRPMFRALDREHMNALQINLWKYNDAPAPQQKQFYQRILNRLKAADPGVFMPPPEAGGPWPAEWLTLFERWINEGMRRLDNATADATKFQATRDPGTTSVTIDGQGTMPSAGHIVWIERAYDPNSLFNEYLPGQFVLYQEQRSVSPPAATPFSIEDVFDVPLTSTQVTVIDTAGQHTINIV